MLLMFTFAQMQIQKNALQELYDLISSNLSLLCSSRNELNQNFNFSSFCDTTMQWSVLYFQRRGRGDAKASMVLLMLASTLANRIWSLDQLPASANHKRHLIKHLRRVCLCLHMCLRSRSSTKSSKTLRGIILQQLYPPIAKLAISS